MSEYLEFGSGSLFQNAEPTVQDRRVESCVSMSATGIKINWENDQGDSLPQSLEDDLQQFGLNHPSFRLVLDDTAKEIVQAALVAPNEATISATFDTKVALALSRIGIKYSPIKEQSLSVGAQRLRGRIDSRVGDVIVEFKQPSTLATERQQLRATNQLLGYAESIVRDTDRTVIGYVTDGATVRTVTISPSGQNIGAFRPLDGDFLLSYSRSVLGTQLRALSATNLVERFSGPESVTKGLAGALYEALDPDLSAGRTQMLFKEWQLLFKLAHDDTSKQQAIEDRRIALQDAVGIALPAKEVISQYRALFAIQTAYSIVLKCIGMNVLQGATSFSTRIDLAAVSTEGLASTQRFLTSMEDGSDLRRNGVENLLEGDFFSWYAQRDQYSEALHSTIVPVIREIADFESLPAFHGDHVAAQDLFKDLYMHMIPEKVRHSLGEYYTPSWLADDTIDRALESANVGSNDEWRMLDPTCGSGTFLTMAMRKVLAQTEHLESPERLKQVLNRIVGVDLNPLAVLTARMNYFINISPLLESESSFHIPVYLGDASVTPSETTLGDVACLNYSIKTLQGSLDITLPQSALSDLGAFTRAMAAVETYTSAKSVELIHEVLCALVDPVELIDPVDAKIRALAAGLVDLEDKDWNGIWPRIIADFLTTAALGDFDIIAGNPPWIDWKNLPENYRRTLVDMCVQRGMFSGDGVTGGINLNVCALITLTAAENWLRTGGALAFLMPDTLLVQQSYEGFRRFKLEGSNRNLYLASLTDWKKAGHPFKPVQQRFNTYVLTQERPNSWPGVPVREMIKTPKKQLPAIASEIAFADLDGELFSEVSTWAEPVHAGRTYYTRGADRDEVQSFSYIAGESIYRGREGIEFYPQELLLFEYVSPGSRPGLAKFRNFQKSSSKHKVPQMVRELETRLMRPVVKGPMIGRFGIEKPKYFVPFYYSKAIGDGRSPIPMERLLREAPKVAELLVSNRDLFESQTEYNQKIIGAKHATSFYAVARVGAYSHADVYVTFRDNTKWGASVVSKFETPWGESETPVFQNHAVTICERPDATFISVEEAHYICAILNSSIVTRFIQQSSENRSFKIRVPVKIDLFDSSNPDHLVLADHSQLAHLAEEKDRKAILRVIDETVLRMATR